MSADPSVNGQRTTMVHAPAIVGFADPQESATSSDTPTGGGPAGAATGSGSTDASVASTGATGSSGATTGATTSFTVSVAGSGLVFQNTITRGFTQAFENDIVSAEQTLAGLWTNALTLNVSFSAVDQGNTGDLASNSFPFINVSYAALRNALISHDQSSTYGQTAAASLPTTDPNPAGGADWSLPLAYARMLGLTTSTSAADDTVTLNTFYNWSYGQDVINTIMHELSEGGMGRVGGLGDQNAAWSTADLFRFNPAGSRDYTDGRDGEAAYFSYNGGQTLSSAPGLSFNNEYAPGRSGPVQVNGGDTADFNQPDVFGTGSPGETDTLSQTDIEFMDVLGWAPATTASTSSATAQLVAEDGGGNLGIYDIGENAILASATGGPANTTLRVLGFGEFSGNPGESDMLMRDPGSGAVQYFDIRNGQIAAQGSAGTIASSWQLLGIGAFSGNANESDLLMRDTATNNIDYFDIQSNQIATSGSFGNIGREWQVLGVGDFSGNPSESDMLMRDSGTNTIDYFDIQNNRAVAAGVFGNIGQEWQVLGIGDFSGNANESDMLMRNTGTNTIDYFDIQHNQIAGYGVFGNIGSEWQPVGFAEVAGNANETDMLMRNIATGAIDYFDIQNNRLAGYGSWSNLTSSQQVLGVSTILPSG